MSGPVVTLDATVDATVAPSLRATVRLQLHAGFDLDAAREQVDYYAELGASHVYLSPILASRHGSTHGYDGVDPTRIDPELGGEAALERLVEALHARGMGVIADIVPNHLAVGAENPWWQDLLAHGRASDYAACFDIDWGQAGADGKLLLPFLGERYETVLENGELVLVWESASGRFAVAYHEHRFPIDPSHTVGVLASPVDHEALGAEDPHVMAALARHDAATPEGRARLHDLLERQAYRLAHWRVANDALNWRRFFDITELAGVRVEDESVFDLSHTYLLSLVERGWIDGLRIDHVDGLADPRGYCLRLRARLDAISQRTGMPRPRRLTLHVEKILAGDETLHDDWGVDGTTGYDFLDQVGGVQHDPVGEAPLTALWREISGRSGDFAAEVRAARQEMLAGPLTAEFERAVAAVSALAALEPATREFTPPAIRRVLGALAVAYPVYRSYSDVNGRPVADEPDFRRALETARATLSAADSAWLPVLDDWFGARAPAAFDEPLCRVRLAAIERFQQLTSPLAAKAVEDTAGYRSAVLLSRNDVGCEGDRFAESPAVFHRASARRQANFPLAMLATATHDHKRGEDVRARLAVLSEMASAIAPTLRAWALDERLYDSDDRPAGGDRLMLLQLLLAAWPLDLTPEDAAGLERYADRLAAWQQKAMREAKLESHWLAPDDAYERSGEDAIRRALAGDTVTGELASLAARLDIPGAINGLAQTTLKLCAPGVPDIYQGTEFWDQSLVDPDNRRPVDMPVRREALAQNEPPPAAWRHWRDGAVKQALIRALLRLRAEQPALFAQGDYIPLDAVGTRAAHVLAFARCSAEATLVVVVTRLPLGVLSAGDDSGLQWGDTTLSLAKLSLQGMGRPWLTDDAIELGTTLWMAEHLGEFPCGVWLWQSQREAHRQEGESADAGSSAGPAA
ncbi:malto-oligosyltrehalose synthase [Salinicola rhizosphaerae]|uniref:Malto-oligosyltrehalose synthase n=1 Tax=Salinicola rhizosphaerae TaxID=1443141 RepID=A0ABQ3DXP8_9GAMM|nr:malto-oligosyltrehalose synthase [Salinicola rhizosphaerae]GHB15920.1 malto-oligosyltrehalose synthase [Salinicola rhizosphaerae]